MRTRRSAMTIANEMACAELSYLDQVSERAAERENPWRYDPKVIDGELHEVAINRALYFSTAYYCEGHWAHGWIVFWRPGHPHDLIDESGVDSWRIFAPLDYNLSL